MMVDIFRSACTIFVWIGLAGVDDALAFATLSLTGERLERRMNRVMANDHEYDEPFETELIARLSKTPECRCCKENFEYPCDDACYLAAVKAVLNLTNRPWFARLWVWQEVFSGLNRFGYLAARARLCCSKHVAPFEELLHCLGDVLSPYQRVDWRESRDNEIVAGMFRGMEIESLETQLRRCGPFTSDVALTMQLDCASRLCSDPRDRVFAMRHLMQIEEIDELRPDYSLSTEEVYRRFIIACIEHRTMMPGVIMDHRDARCAISWIFALATTEEATLRDESWPSWLPDFNNLTEQSRLVSDPYAELVVSRGFKQDATMFRYHIDPTTPRELSIKGHCFGRVERILGGSAWPVNDAHSTLFENAAGHAKIAQIVRWYFHCKGFIEDHTGDPAVSNWLDAFLVQQSDICYDRVAQYSHKWEIVRSLLDYTDRSDDLASIMEVIEPHRTRNKQVLLCHLVGENFEDVAWVPKGALVGDTFCMFAGQPYPFLLRARGDGRYTLVGDAMLGRLNLLQILGMDAAAMKLKLDQRWAPDNDPASNWETEDENEQKFIDALHPAWS